MIIAGIDPGLNGAICLYDPLQLDRKNNRVGVIIDIFDMPTFEIKRNGKKRREIDLYALARWIDNHHDITKAYIENPQGMPGMSSNSTSQLGQNVGIAKMAIASRFIPMELLAPATWKKRMGLTKDKDSCRRKASQIIPSCSHMFSRVKDDGRAESFLIAYYGSKLEEKGFDIST